MSAERAERAEVRWIGHASAAVSIGGDSVIVDPLGRRRCSALDDYRAVLITHAHIDHLNRWTLASLNREAQLIVPKGAGHIVKDLGFRKLTEVEAGDQVSVGGFDITAVTTKHDEGRWRKGDGPTCAGYVLQKNGLAIHHAGDVDMSDYGVFDDIGKRFALDATLLPIGGMLPVWYYRLRKKALDRGIHIDPDTALHIFERLGAKRMIPVHWGTVNLRLGPPSMPSKRLRTVAHSSGKGELVHILNHGQTLQLTSPQSPSPDETSPPRQDPPEQ